MPGLEEREPVDVAIDQPPGAYAIPGPELLEPQNLTAATDLEAVGPPCRPVIGL